MSDDGDLDEAILLAALPGEILCGISVFHFFLVLFLKIFIFYLKF